MRTCSAARCQLDTFGVQSRSTEYRTPHDLGKLIAADDPKFSERELRVSRKWRFASDTSGAPPYCILPEPMSGPALHGSLSTLKPPQLSSGQNGNTTFGGSLLLEERNHGRYIDSLSASFPRHCSEQPNARRPHENLHRRELECAFRTSPTDSLATAIHSFTKPASGLLRCILQPSYDGFWNFTSLFPIISGLNIERLGLFHQKMSTSA